MDAILHRYATAQGHNEKFIATGGLILRLSTSVIIYVSKFESMITLF